MRPFRKIEIGAEFTIDTPQQVKIERRRDTLFVVVRVQDHSRVLLHIESDEKTVIVAEDRTKISKKSDRVVSKKITDIRTQKQNNLACAVSILQRAQHL